jgi:signal transduction histidine kinase
MKKISTIFYFLLLFIKTIAQSNLPPAYEIKTDTILYNKLPNSCWQILEDTNGKFNFAEVSNPPVAKEFHYQTADKIKFDYAIHGYWFRYVLKNTMNHDAKISLGDNLYSLIPFFSPQNEESDFFCIYPDGNVTHLVNGFLTPWSKLDGLKENRIIPIMLHPGEQLTIYRRIYNTYKFFPSPESDFWVGFSSTDKIIKQDYAKADTKYFNNIQNSFLFGVLLFASLFIFFFFIIVREKVYLYFSLYLLSLGIGRFNIYSEMYHVFFREYPVLYVYIFQFIWFLSIFFLIYFIRYLLNTKQFLPWWNKFLVVSTIVFTLTYLISLINQFSTNYNLLLDKILQNENIILALSIPVVILMSLKRIKTSKVLIFIVLPLQIAWSICFTIFSLGGLQTTWHSIETILLSCLVISFSWILLHRFADLRKQIVQKELEKEIERSKLIESQKIELEEQVTYRTAELKESLKNLKSTQAQLIQSEKLASLGEMTAGIAHEIQNPLNFVNNFSEVNKELLVEMNEEIEKGNYNEVKSIAKGVTENEEKIIHHGKRADAIVKGMLQHSRLSTGKIEPTNINALADEYLRLSYHGLRAKDKEFNATMNTDFDNSIDKINIIPQDIGRVLLNLYNNAFYAVTEKKKSAEVGYEPTVSVSTKKIDNNVTITVKDNGNGITQKVVDKIFQPFFTTKPPGVGTGLGLSLSYDIVKAHGGGIKVETKESEFTEFVVQLPILA